MTTTVSAVRPRPASSTGMRWLAKAAPTVAMVLAVATVAVTLVLPRLTGGVALTVLSGSMTPTYPVGSLVVVRPVEPEQVTIDDVITFQSEPNSTAVTSHRVIGIDTDADSGARTFTTKGDANRGADSDPVPAAAVRGRVWFHVPMLGRLRDALGDPVVLGVLGALMAATALVDPVRRAMAGGKAAATQPESTMSLDDSDRDRDRDPLQLLVARIDAGPSDRHRVVTLVERLGGRIDDVTDSAVHLHLTAAPDRLDHCERLLTAAHPGASVARSQPVPIPASMPRGLFVAAGRMP
jgi:signal peptidase